MPDKEDERVTRASDLGLNAEGINTDPDAGQAQVQEKADREAAVGFVPGDAANLGADESVSVEELAEQQKEANKQFTMPPEGHAADPMPAPHRGGVATAEEVEEGETGETSSGDDKPAKSASREEWDAYARSQGVDPTEFSTKDDLIANFD